MIVIGLASVFLGYTIGIWGYCLVRGYNVPFMALFKGVWPGATATKAAPVQVA